MRLNIIYTCIVSSEVKNERLGVDIGAPIATGVHRSGNAPKVRSTPVVRAVPTTAAPVAPAHYSKGRTSLTRRAGVLVVVMVFHIALIALLLMQHSRARPPVLMSPLQVHVVSDLQSRAETRPVPTPTLERPHIDVVAPEVTIVTPAPEAAIAPPTVSATPPAAAPAVKAPTAPPEPVTPPRFDASYLKNPPPVYPAASRRLREQGTVVLRVLVSQQGTAADVLVENSSGSAQLDAAAMNAVRHWRFVPARRGSESIDAWVLVPVGFELQR
jgi:protein TonB